MIVAVRSLPAYLVVAVASILITHVVTYQIHLVFHSLSLVGYHLVRDRGLNLLKNVVLKAVDRAGGVSLDL